MVRLIKADLIMTENFYEVLKSVLVNYHVNVVYKWSRPLIKHLQKSTFFRHLSEIFTKTDLLDLKVAVVLTKELQDYERSFLNQFYSLQFLHVHIGNEVPDSFDLLLTYPERKVIVTSSDIQIEEQPYLATNSVLRSYKPLLAVQSKYNEDDDSITLYCRETRALVQPKAPVWLKLSLNNQDILALVPVYSGSYFRAVVVGSKDEDLIRIKGIKKLAKAYQILKQKLGNLESAIKIVKPSEKLSFVTTTVS